MESQFQFSVDLVHDRTSSPFWHGGTCHWLAAQCTSCRLHPEVWSAAMPGSLCRGSSDADREAVAEQKVRNSSLEINSHDNNFQSCLTSWGLWETARPTKPVVWKRTAGECESLHHLIMERQSLNKCYTSQDDYWSFKRNLT